MKTKCRECGRDGTTVVTEDRPYPESGLPNVMLMGVPVRVCPHCGERALVLPSIAELHRVLAHEVIKKHARLSGPEIRFLRKFIGWSATDFASHMGTDPSTVSNWETDKKPIGSSSDRLLRLMVVQHDQVDDYSLDALMDISSEQAPPIELHMRPRNRGWQRDAVAADGA